MAASKKKSFTFEENEIALIGRAYAHPARVRILKILGENGYTRNCDLVAILGLDKSTIHDHVKKLEDAGLIKIEFNLNSFCMSSCTGTYFCIRWILFCASNITRNYFFYSFYF